MSQAKNNSNNIFWSAAGSRQVATIFSWRYHQNAYNNKLERADCSNYRGLTLHTVPENVLAGDWLNSLVSTVAKEDVRRAIVATQPTEGSLA